MINREGNRLIVTDRFGDSVTMYDCKDGSLLIDGAHEDVAFLQEDVVGLRDFLNEVIDWRAREW
jgi:hypothetical protein